MGFLSKKAVGLDISDNSIEIVELSVASGKEVVRSSARVQLQDGVVEEGRIVNPELLATALRTAFRSAQPKIIESENIVFGLSDSLVYTHLYADVVVGIDENINDVVKKEAEQSIPLSKKELIFSYKNFRREGDKISGVIYAINKKDLIEWQNFFEDNNFKVEFFETKMHSLLRPVVKKYTKFPLCFVDMGASETNVIVFDSEGVIYSDTIKVGGEKIIIEIAESLNIESLEDAEKMMAEQGLSDPGSKLCNCIIDTIDDVAAEIKKSVTYSGAFLDKQIETIVLSGGVALTPGIIDYFAANLDIETISAESNIEGLHTNPHELIYLKAVGLGLRLLDQKWQQDPIFPRDILKDVKKKTKEAPKKIAESFDVDNSQTLYGQKRGNSLIKKIKEYQKEILLLVLIVVLMVIVMFALRNNRSSIREDSVPAEVSTILQNLPDVREVESIPVAEEVSIEREAVKQLKVLDTPTGYLNVRSGPSITHNIVHRVYPQEIYVFSGVENDWYIIDLLDGTDGWVISDYVEEIPVNN